MILNALKYIAQRRPYFDIYLRPTDRGRLLDDLYMRRWWLLGGSNPDRDDRPDDVRRWKRGRIDAFVGRWIACRLHHIVRPDRSRDFHTHPATFVSIVIRGWYFERRPDHPDQPAQDDEWSYTDTLRRAGSIALRRADDRHTIIEVSPGGCWTVVIWFRKRGSWGFWRQHDGKFVDWRDYVCSHE